jgi:hypothetical protein
MDKLTLAKNLPVEVFSVREGDPVNFEPYRGYDTVTFNAEDFRKGIQHYLGKDFRIITCEFDKNPYRFEPFLKVQAVPVATAWAAMTVTTEVKEQSDHMAYLLKRHFGDTLGYQKQIDELIEEIERMHDYGR